MRALGVAALGGADANPLSAARPGTGRSRVPSADAPMRPPRATRPRRRSRQPSATSSPRTGSRRSPRSTLTALPARPSSGTGSTATRSCSTAGVGRRWPANLLRDARIAVTVVDAADGYRWVGLTGTAAPITDQATAQADIAEMARRYHADDPAEAERLIADGFQRQERISLPRPRRRRPRPSRRRLRRADPIPVKFGLQLWSQQTDWPAFRDSALAAEADGLGFGLDAGTTCSPSSDRGSSPSSRAGPRWPRSAP